MHIAYGISLKAYIAKQAQCRETLRSNLEQLAYCLYREKKLLVDQLQFRDCVIHFIGHFNQYVIFMPVVLAALF